MSDRTTGPESFVRYSKAGKPRTYFRCPVEGCDVTIRKDGTQSAIAIREHRASHEVAR